MITSQPQPAQNTPLSAALSKPFRHLPLRAKIYALAIVGITLCMVVVFLISRMVLMDSYRRLEDQAVRQNVQRVLNFVDDQLTSMERTSADWAYSDDTFQYINTRNPLYIQSNLNANALQQLHLSLIVLLDTSGQIVAQKAENLTTGEEMPLPGGLDNALTHGSPLLNHDQPTDVLSGLLMLDDGPMLIASRAILPTNETGPPRGTLILGRLLDESEIAVLADRTQVSVSSRTIGHDTLIDDFLAASTALAQPATSIFVRPLSNTLIGGYTLSPDLFGKPLVLWRVEMPREISATGRNSVSYFLMMLAIVALIFVGLLLILVERFVLSPVGYLHRSVARISATEATPAIVLPNGDELGDLASAINQMVTDLHQAQDSLRQSLQFKSDVLANVSHDARSPVSTIKLRAEMLLLGVNGALMPQQKQSVESIQSSADQLLFFVNNLLDASRLDAKSITLLWRPLSPAELIDEVVKSMAVQASEKGIGLHFTAIGAITPSIDGDAERLRQIMSNLVDNAIKFTDKGEINVSLRQPDAAHLRIDVVDTGIGIKAEEQGRIFEAFYQADGSMTRRQIHGVGLGLSIVKQLVELMNGTITVESSLNVGTTFTLTLSLDTAGEPSL